MAEIQTTYETQFTKENILDLKNAINRGINTYAEEEMNGEKLDLFVILSALQQASYELVMRSMPANDEEAKKAYGEMTVVANKILTTIDENRKELGTRAIDEILGSIHAASILGEFYVRRRDEALKKLQDQATVMNGENNDSVAENPNPDNGSEQ